MQPRLITGIHTTGAYTGDEIFKVTVAGRSGTTVMGIAETTNVVPVGVEDGCVTTVVVHWQRQVDTKKSEFTL